MKIIDAHFHIFPPDPRNDQRTRSVGHENSIDHLRQVYTQLGMVHGVVMGNRSLDPAYHDYPGDLFHYKPNARWGESYAYLADILCPGALEG